MNFKDFLSMWWEFVTGLFMLIPGWFLIFVALVEFWCYFHGAPSFFLHDSVLAFAMGLYISYKQLKKRSRPS